MSARADALVGTWRLVSASTSMTSGLRNETPFGPSPTGILIYTPAGQVTALVSYGGRKPLSSADRVTAPADERADAFATFFAYAGRYSLDGDTVVHHVEIASVENWVNEKLVRVVTLAGNRLTLRMPPLGEIRVSELIWERVGGH